MKNIKNLSNWELISHYKDAVCDNNYNPTSEDYNKSGFSFTELEAEILERMGSNNNTDDEEDYE